MLLLPLVPVSASQDVILPLLPCRHCNPSKEKREEVSTVTYWNVDSTYNNSTIGQTLLNNIPSMMILSNNTVLFLTGPLSTIFIPSFYTVVCILSVPLNGVAMVTFAWHIQPKNPAVIYMLNLACADLLFVMLLPFKIFYHFNGNNWTLDPLLCRVVTAAFYCNMYCSVLLITCISVDRLLAVVYPIESLAWRRPQSAIIACVTMWALAFNGSVAFVFSEQTVDLPHLGITTCHEVQDVDQIRWHYKIYFITICCTLFFLPLLIAAASYTGIIWTICRVPHGVMGHSRRKVRALVIALMVLVIFVLCFTPTNCLLMVYLLKFTDDVSAAGQDASEDAYLAYLVYVCLGSLNCCLDPLVYYFGSSQFQKQVANMLRCQKHEAAYFHHQALPGPPAKQL